MLDIFYHLNYYLSIYMTDKINNLIWAIPIIALLVALSHMPYGYYTLLRIVVTGCSGYLAYIEYARTQSISLFAVLFTFLAILFNQFIPIFFSKIVWVWLDCFAILVFGIHACITAKDKINSTH